MIAYTLVFYLGFEKPMVKYMLNNEDVHNIDEALSKLVKE